MRYWTISFLSFTAVMLIAILLTPFINRVSESDREYCFVMGQLSEEIIYNWDGAHSKGYACSVSPHANATSRNMSCYTSFEEIEIYYQTYLYYHGNVNEGYPNRATIRFSQNSRIRLGSVISELGEINTRRSHRIHNRGLIRFEGATVVTASSSTLYDPYNRIIQINIESLDIVSELGQSICNSN